MGWQPAWFSEIEAFPNEVLKARHPSIPNLGDMTYIRDLVAFGEVEAPDLIVGGTPCQAFSVAGKKESLDDDRGQLTLEFVRLADAIDKERAKRGEEGCIIVWENVPGVLSTKDNAFGCFLGALAGEDSELQPSGKKWTNSGCVFGPKRTIAWRILDAQYFGVAQRRRRVFVVASARAGFDPTTVLFEREGLRRDTPPSREAWKEAAGDARKGVERAGSHWDDLNNPHPSIVQSHNTGGIGSSNQEVFSQRGAGLVPFNIQRTGVYSPEDVGSTCAARDYKGPTDLVVHKTQDTCFGIPGNWIGRKPENGGNQFTPMDEIAPCQTRTDIHGVAYAIQGSMIGRNDNAGPQGDGVNTDVCFTQNTSDRHGVAYAFAENSRAELRLEGGSGDRTVTVLQEGFAVRRLTPVECERLQGFPDNYTQIPWRGKPASECPDGPRYKALGNSKAVPVVRWLGHRINQWLIDRVTEDHGI